METAIWSAAISQDFLCRSFQNSFRLSQGYILYILPPPPKKNWDKCHTPMNKVAAGRANFYRCNLQTFYPVLLHFSHFFLHFINLHFKFFPQRPFQPPPLPSPLPLYYAWYISLFLFVFIYTLYIYNIYWMISPRSKNFI